MSRCDPIHSCRNIYSQVSENTLETIKIFVKDVTNIARNR